MTEERAQGGFQKGPGNSEVYWVLCWVAEGSLILSSVAWHPRVAYFEDLQEGDAGAERLCSARGLTYCEKALYFCKIRCGYDIVFLQGFAEAVSCQRRVLLLVSRSWCFRCKSDAISVAVRLFTALPCSIFQVDRVKSPLPAGSRCVAAVWGTPGTLQCPGLCSLSPGAEGLWHRGGWGCLPLPLLCTAATLLGFHGTLCGVVLESCLALSLALENAIFWTPEKEKIKSLSPVTAAGAVPHPLFGCGNCWALQQGVGLLPHRLGVLGLAPGHGDAAVSLLRLGTVQESQVFEQCITFQRNLEELPSTGGFICFCFLVSHLWVKLTRAITLNPERGGRWMLPHARSSVLCADSSNANKIFVFCVHLIFCNNRMWSSYSPPPPWSAA